MRSSTPTDSPSAADVRWRAIFEDRHGPGSVDRLLAVLSQPCVSFAEIAERFGVTRERVRQWHLHLMPGAPRGHERQRLCWQFRQKRTFLLDPLFRSFYANARRVFDRGQLGFVESRHGFQKHIVQLNRRTVLIRQARPIRTPSKRVYVLRGGLRPSDFMYYRLSGNDFLFIPRSALPQAGTTFVDNGTSKYQRFRNSFTALDESRGAEKLERRLEASRG